jgi:hypothetical protein
MESFGKHRSVLVLGFPQFTAQVRHKDAHRMSPAADRTAAKAATNDSSRAAGFNAGMLLGFALHTLLSGSSHSDPRIAAVVPRGPGRRYDFICADS